MTWLGTVAALAVLLSACSGASDSFSDGCLGKIRYKGEAYVEVGFSNRHVASAGKAAILTCAADAHTKSVTAVTLSGYRDTDVIAVRQHGDVYRVFAAERLGEAYVDSLRDAHLLNAGDD